MSTKDGTKTEHCGAKHGSGAYWGRKVVAKAISRKLRRQRGQDEVRRQLAEVTS